MQQFKNIKIDSSSLQTRAYNLQSGLPFTRLTWFDHDLYILDTCNGHFSFFTVLFWEVLKMKFIQHTTAMTRPFSSEKWWPPLCYKQNSRATNFDCALKKQKTHNPSKYCYTLSCSVIQRRRSNTFDLERIQTCISIEFPALCCLSCSSTGMKMSSIIISWNYYYWSEFQCRKRAEFWLGDSWSNGPFYFQLL